MRPHLLAPSLLAFAALLLPTGALALTLDRFTEALPPNPCLPLSGQRVVFAGAFCDGPACPPAPWATCASTDVVQTGLAGVLAGTRRHIVLFPFGDGGGMSARIDAAARRLLVSFDATTEVGLAVNYGTPYVSTPAPDALNLDLVSLGVEGVRLDLDGTFTPAQPLFVSIQFLTDDETAPRPSAHAEITVSLPGTVTIPLAAFQPRLGFTMTDVDDVEVWFSHCADFEYGCPDATYDPSQFSLGAIEFVTGTTPAVRSSWGKLKSIYR